MRTLLCMLYFAAFAFVNAMSYSTTFSGGDENPISEGGKWLRNSSVGSFWWQNVKVAGGVARGADIHQTSDYQDPTAILSGSWGPNQSAGAKFHKSSTPAGSSYAECEIRLRTTLTANSNRGYECLFSLNGYTNIVRWNGPESNFTILTSGSGINMKSGDSLRATISGSTITMYLNGTQIAQATDNAVTSGSPGIGFDAADNGTSSRQSVYDQFGFDSFSATDEPPSLSPGGTAAARPAQSFRITSPSRRAITVSTRDPGVLRGAVYSCNGAFVASFEATKGNGAAIPVAQPGLFFVRFSSLKDGPVSHAFVN